MKNIFPFFASVIVLCGTQLSSGMKIPHKDCPDLSVYNNSQEDVIGWLYKTNHEDFAQSKAETFALMPQKITERNPISRDVMAVLAAIDTKSRRYNVQAIGNRLELVLLCTRQIVDVPLCTETRYVETMYKVQEIPLDQIAQLACIIVRPDGNAALISPGYKPQDDRPDVKLEVYKELTGHELYATPEFILGLPANYTKQSVSQAYKTFIGRWNLYYSKTEYSTDTFKLVLWAKRQLDIRKC